MLVIRNKKKQTSDTCNKIDECQKHWKKTSFDMTSFVLYYRTNKTYLWWQTAGIWALQVECTGAWAVGRGGRSVLYLDVSVSHRCGVNTGSLPYCRLFHVVLTKHGHKKIKRNIKQKFKLPCAHHTAGLMWRCSQHYHWLGLNCSLICGVFPALDFMNTCFSKSRWCPENQIKMNVLNWSD
jgi:hypothetical protein